MNEFIELLVRLYQVCAEVAQEISKDLAISTYKTMELDEERSFLILFGVGTFLAFALGILFFGMAPRAYVPPIWFFIYVWSYHPYVPGQKHKTLFGAWREDYLMLAIIYRIITVLGLLAGLVRGIPEGIGYTLLSLIVAYIVCCIVAKYAEEQEKLAAERAAMRDEQRKERRF